MTDPALGLLMLGLIVVVILMGFPTAFTLMGLGMFFGFYAFYDPSQHWIDNRVFDLMVQRTYGAMTNDVLISIPLFVFMGYVIERANILDRLFKSLQLAAGPVVDRTPDVKIIGANEVNRSDADSTALGTVSNPNLSRKNTLFVGGSLALLLVVAVLFMRRPEEPTPPTVPELASTPSHSIVPAKPESTTITIRATVSPADARILIDGRNVGKSGDALVLPREKKEHAVRIEREGYEAQTMWVTADTDKQLGPITLVNLRPVVATSGPGSAAFSLPGGKPVPAKNKLNKDLQKPKELGGTK